MEETAYPLAAKPNLLQRFKLATVYGRVHYGWYGSECSEPVELFMFHCPKTGLYVVEREHGFQGYLCNQCARCKFNPPNKPTHDLAFTGKKF